MKNANSGSPQGVLAALRHGDLEEFLCGKTGFCNHVTACFGEAVIEGVVVADADHVADLVPVKVGVKTIGGEGRVVVVQLAVTARQVQSVARVGQDAFSHPIDAG